MTAKRYSRPVLYYTMLLALVIFVALNLVANRLFESRRLDLTEHKLYTLSEGTRAVISRIDEPLTMRFFYSEEAANGFPVIQNYGARLKGLLKQYAALSEGKLKLEIINPEPFSESEDLAVSNGVRGIDTNAAGNKLFFGLSINNAVDEMATIPFFSPERQAFLEYDITRMIDRLSYGKKTNVGVLSWLPMRGTAQGLMAGRGPWAILQQMEEFFDVDVLKVDTDSIPQDIDVLLVAHPAPISDQTLYAIDQYMMRGGKAIFLIDPGISVDDVPEKRSTLEPLLSAWGVKMKDKYVAGDMQAAIRVSTSDDVTALGAAPNVTWLMLRQPNFNQREILTAELNSMILPTPGILETVAEAKTTVTSLISTGEQSFFIRDIKLMFAKENPTVLMDDMMPSDHPLMLAAKVEGILNSAFPEGKGKEHLTKSAKPASFVVVADTDFLRDGFWVQQGGNFGSDGLTPSADNGAFLLNAIDYLSGDSALLSLRTRTTDERRFTVVDDLRRDAEERFHEEEEALRRKLREVEQQMGDLQAQEGGSVLMSEEQQVQLEKFRDILLETRHRLRDVQGELRRDIESLGGRLKLIHIGLIPILVLLIGLVLPRRLGMKRS